MAKNITPTQLQALTNRDGFHRLAPNLYLQVRGEGRSYIFRYQRGTRQISLGLGSCALVSYDEARAKALEYRHMLAKGIDPQAEKRREFPTGAVPTFEECAAKVIEALRPSWKNEKHAAQWESTLRMYAFPKIGRMPVNQITLPDVVAVLRPIWIEKNETASRLRGRIEQVLSWAKSRDLIAGDNPASWELLQHSLPSRNRVAKVEHHPALPLADIPAFMKELHGNACVSSWALQFTILTAARTNETVGAVWPGIDLAAKVWTVPAERMKAGRPHRVPLSPQAMAILNALPHRGDYVFPGGKRGKPLSNMAMLELLRGMRGKGLTVHGTARSTFRDWCSENGYSAELAERALAHAVKSKTEAAYLRTDLLIPAAL